MRHLAFLSLGLLGGVLIMCGGTSSSVVNCVPGASVACTGPGGCATNQVCASDGKSYGPCVCGGGDGGQTLTDSGSSSGGGGEAGSSSGSSSGGSSGSSGGDGAAWTPASLSGLSLWLDADVGIVDSTTQAGVIVRWLDQSGNGNTATAETGQNSFTIDPQVQNGHDAVICPGNGSTMNIADGPTVQFGTGDFGILVVEKGGGGNYWLKDTSMLTGINFGINNGSYGLTAATSNVVLATGNSSQFHIVAARGQSLRLVSSDGQSATGPTNTVDISEVGRPVTICSTGEIAELIVVKGTVSDQDLASAMGYLKAKYKL